MLTQEWFTTSRPTPSISGEELARQVATLKHESLCVTQTDGVDHVINRP